MAKEDVIEFEIKNWGLKDTYLGCNCLRLIPKIIDRLDMSMTFSDICLEISKETEHSALTVSSAISFIRKKANLERSFIFTKLYKLHINGELTNDIFIKEIIDLCKKSKE